jgi:indole-3-glycerol phosphate synthase
MTILDLIIAAKGQEVAGRRAARPLEEVKAAAGEAPPARSLAAALARRDGLRVIAEVKKASPSRGVIRADFDAPAIARAYARSGAAAVSVLTDEKHFQGRLEDLERIRCAVDLPLLRKDFIIDPYQVWEARAAGADAVLLILAALPDAQLELLAAEAQAAGLEVLWEAHDRGDMERLRGFAPRLAGINNRNLRTFEVTLETTRELLPLAPAGALVVSESGFSRREELETMRGWGVDAFLIGESLMRAADPGEALAELLGGTEGAWSR